jgi:hypothetical protein
MVAQTQKLTVMNEENIYEDKIEWCPICHCWEQEDCTCNLSEADYFDGDEYAKNNLYEH